MKKLVFMFVAFVAMSFAACGGQTADTAGTNVSDSVIVDSIDSILTVDSVVADSAVAE